MIRPAARKAMMRWSEATLATAVAIAGLWLALRGGWIFLPLGLGLAILGAGYARAAYRRAQFAQNTASAGFVEVDEGQIAYFADERGGFISLPEVVELRLLTLSQRRYWRLKQRDGQALLIPIDAAQNAALFDAFAALPGMDSAVLIAALNPAPRQTAPSQGASRGASQRATNLDATQTLWRRDPT